MDERLSILAKNIKYVRTTIWQFVMRKEKSITKAVVMLANERAIVAKDNETVYKAAGCSVLADRIRLYRARKAAVEKLEDSPDTLWECLMLFAEYPFKTSKGLSFTYTIKGNEMFVTRKEKSITRATVLLAYEKAVELGGAVKGPKTLGCFGASYLYPVFIRLGVIRLPE